MSNIGTTDPFFEISKGNIDGHERLTVRGVNPDVDTGAAENIWDLGGIFVYPTAGEQLELSSSDAADTSAGTGAQQVELTYLDDAYIKQTETITMNGVSIVTTVATDIFRPIGLRVIAVGSGSENAGIITMTVVSAGADRIGILIGENLSQHGFYTVPAGKTAFVVSAYTTIEKGKDMVIELLATIGEAGIFYGIVPVQVYQSSTQLVIMAPFPVVEKSDVKFLCSTQNDNTAGNIILQIIEVDD